MTFVRLRPDVSAPAGLALMRHVTTSVNRQVAAVPASNPCSGITLGRWLWTVFARQIYAVPEPVVPVGSLLLLSAIALILVNLVAAGPGRSAARTPAALALRSE